MVAYSKDENMFNIRQLTLEEMEYVAGGASPNRPAVSTPPGDDSWDGLIKKGYDVGLGSINGWSFGISYASSGLGVWSTSPSGVNSFHAYSSGANWTANFGSVSVSFGMTYNGSSGYTQISWAF